MIRDRFKRVVCERCGVSGGTLMKSPDGKGKVHRTEAECRRWGGALLKQTKAVKAQLEKMTPEQIKALLQRSGM